MFSTFDLKNVSSTIFVSSGFRSFQRLTVNDTMSFYMPEYDHVFVGNEYVQSSYFDLLGKNVSGMVTALWIILCIIIKLQLFFAVPQKSSIQVLLAYYIAEGLEW